MTPGPAPAVEIPKSVRRILARGGGSRFPCPVAGCDEEVSAVTDSRALGSGLGIRRRRICASGHRWTTTESIQIAKKSRHVEAAQLATMAADIRAVADRLESKAAQLTIEALTAGEESAL